jgi:iron complex transport system substrate-binding protein
MNRLFALLLAVFCLSLLAAPASAAPLTLSDDTGATIRLAGPAQRIVVLAPHIVENLYAIGAEKQIVAAVDYSDYPPAASQLPRVGGHSRFDLESILIKKPDLIIGWASGNPAAQLDQVRALGIPLYLSQPNRFEDVARELRQFGQLTGHPAAAEAAAGRFLQRLDRLRQANAGKPRVRVFYQIWQEPLMTIGGEQIISSAITACGGENVFAPIRAMAAQVSEEAVLAADAEAFVAGGMGDTVADPRRDWLDPWRRWKQLTAVKRDNLFYVPADLMQRHTLRLIDGAEQLCAQLDRARSRRPK